MSAAVHSTSVAPTSWRWPVDLARYDRSPALTRVEHDALATVSARLAQGTANYAPQCLVALHRLVQPIDDVSTLLAAPACVRPLLRHRLLRAMHERGRSFWAWSADEWLTTIDAPASSHARHANHAAW